MELAVDKLAFVDIAIELELAMTSLLAIDKITCILDLVILPLLGALAMIHVVKPLAIVHRTILVNEHSISACLSFLPLAVINVAIFMRNPSLPMEQTFQCHPLVH